MLGLLGKHKFSRFQVRIRRSLLWPVLARTDSEAFVTSEGASFPAEPHLFVVGQKAARMNEPRASVENPSEKGGLRSSSVAAFGVH